MYVYNSNKIKMNKLQLYYVKKCAFNRHFHINYTGSSDLRYGKYSKQ